MSLALMGAGKALDIAGAPPPTYDATVLATAGLLSYWPLNETSGTAAADLKGTNTGLYQNGFTLGLAGPTTDGATAVGFNGTNANVRVKNAAAILAALPNATVEAFVFPDSTGSLSGHPFYGERNAAGNAIWVAEVAPATSASGPLFFTHRDDAAVLNQPNAGTVATDVWSHVAITKAGTAITFYVNGASVGSGTLTGNDTLTGIDGSYIGFNSGGAWWQGRIGRVAVYNVAVPGATITAHYAAR